MADDDRTTSGRDPSAESNLQAVRTVEGTESSPRTLVRVVTTNPSSTGNPAAHAFASARSFRPHQVRPL